MSKIKTMELKQVSEAIHRNAVNKGFWEDKETKNMGEVLMLCVSELSEALEAHRKNRKADLIGFKERSKQIQESYVNQPGKLDDEDFKKIFESRIKDTFEDEVADTVIRLFDLCEGFEIDLKTHIELKLYYNTLRPYKHNKAY